MNPPGRKRIELDHCCPVMREDGLRPVFLGRQEFPDDYWGWFRREVHGLFDVDVRTCAAVGCDRLFLVARRAKSIKWAAQCYLRGANDLFKWSGSRDRLSRAVLESPA